MDWLNNGDQNTTFFHNNVRLQSHYNTITQILDSFGNYITDRSDIENRFLSFYSNLWTGSSDLRLHDTFNALPYDLPTLSNVDGHYVTRELSRDELYTTLSELPPGKAPGPNGFNAEFYRYFWTDIGDHLFKAFRFFFTNSAMPTSWGMTFVALIPKISNPSLSLTVAPYPFAMSALKLLPRLLLTGLSQFSLSLLAVSKLALFPIAVPSII